MYKREKGSMKNFFFWSFPTMASDADHYSPYCVLCHVQCPHVATFDDLHLVAKKNSSYERGL